jgi:hypothetical protein
MNLPFLNQRCNQGGKAEATQAYFSYVEEPIADANEDSALI